MNKHTIYSFAIAAAVAAFCLSVNAQTVETTITLPNTSVGGIVANAINNRIYVVSNSGSADVDDTVTVIDGKSDTIVANISVPVGAYYPAVDILSDRVYVASCNSNLNPSPCFVTVIDGKANTVITTIPVSTVLNGLLAGIAVNPITRKVYVSDNTNRDIAVIDAKTNTLAGTISVAGYPWGLAINPFTNELYVTFGTSFIDIIDVSTGKLVQVSSGDGTVGRNVAVDLFTGRTFVTNTKPGSSTTSILDDRGNLLAQVPTGDTAVGVDVDPFSELVFIADVEEQSTSIIKERTNTVKSTVSGTGATFLSANALTRKVYAAGNGTVTVFPER